MEEINISCDDDDHHHLLNNIIIPEDVLIQILVLLSVLSLLQFKSVCKSWRALIQSSLFIHLHLNTTLPLSSNDIGTFIFQVSGYNGNKTRAFMLSGGSGSDGEKEDELKWEDLGFPPRYNFFMGTYSNNVFIVGSCNGLICIHDSKRMEVCLWNPATRQYRLLPKSITLEGIGDPADKDFAVFGYDVKTKDYKVVLISQFIPYIMRKMNRTLSVNEFIFRIQIYSLTTDSWRLLEEGINSLPTFPRQPGGLNHGVYLKNGSYYFLGTPHYNSGSKLSLMLLSFDFTKEIFTTIQLPHDSNIRSVLTCFGGKLAFFAPTKARDDESDFEFYDIWVQLNEHGVKEEESWAKLHSTVPNSEGFGAPKAISNSGEFALLAAVCYSLVNVVSVSTRQLQLLNLVTKEIKKEFITGNHVLTADVYKQSLVSIGGNDTIGDRVVPVIGMGTLVYPLVESELKAAVLCAIKVGYRHFDTASIYLNDQPLGEAISEALQLGLIKSRDELFSTSKLWCTDAHPGAVLPAIRNTLRNLQLEYLDLYLVHMPISVKPGSYDYPTPKEDLLPMDFESVWADMEKCQSWPH